MRDTPKSLSNKIIMRRIWQGWVVPYLPRLIGALLLMALVAGTASGTLSCRVADGAGMILRGDTTDRIAAISTCRSV